MSEGTGPKVEALTKRVTTRLSDSLLARIDTAVQEGPFPNRSAVIRTAVRDQFGTVQTDGDDRFLRECESCGQRIDTRPGYEAGTQHAPDCPIRKRRFPDSLPAADTADEAGPDTGGGADGE